MASLLRRTLVPVALLFALTPLVRAASPAIDPGLIGLPNAILTPHMAGGTEAAQHGLASLAADNLIAALGLGPDAGHPPSILNPEVLTR